MKRVIGLGAGGHAKVVIDILKLNKDCEIVGLVDPKRELWNTTVSGIPVLGDDSLLPKLYTEGVCHAFIGLGTAADTRPRKELYEKARRHGFEIVEAIHPQAVIAASVKIGDGPTIMAGVIINPWARLGDNVIINTAAVVEHDCVIADHVHVATGARLASTVQIGEGAHVGMGASVRQCLHIGRNSIVGAGAAVVDNVPEKVVVVGVPARILRRVKD